MFCSQLATKQNGRTHVLGEQEKSVDTLAASRENDGVRRKWRKQKQKQNEEGDKQTQRRRKKQKLASTRDDLHTPGE
jgi:hypothetical protein